MTDIVNIQLDFFNFHGIIFLKYERNNDIMHVHPIVTVTYPDDTTQDIHLPEGTQELHKHVCRHYKNAKRIIIPVGIIRIGNHAFANFKNLISVTIPVSVTEVGGSAFYSCTRLSSLYLPPSVTTIGSLAFAECHSLSSIYLPPSIRGIDRGAFLFCTSLTSLSLPASLISIGDIAFTGCTNLTSISLPTYEKIFDDVTQVVPLSISPHLIRRADGSTICSTIFFFVPLSLNPFSEQFSNNVFQNCPSLSTILTSHAHDNDANNAFPHSATVITIESIIPSLREAIPAKRNMALSLINLDASSFTAQPELYLSHDGLQQLVNSPHKDLLNHMLPHMTNASIGKATPRAFPSLRLQKIRNLFSLDDQTYTFMHQAVLHPNEQLSLGYPKDGSLDFLLPIVYHTTLKDLTHLRLISKKPLQALLHSDKHTTQQPQHSNQAPINRCNPPRTTQATTLRLNPLGLVCALILSVCTLGIYPLVRYYLSPRNRFSWHLPSFMYTRKPPNRFHTTNTYPQATTSMRFIHSDTATKNDHVRPAPQSTKKDKPLRTTQTPHR